jgi:predicted transcriptional regulator
LAGFKELKMKQLTVKTATEADFFARGRNLARLADHAKPLPEECVISFEDPAEMLQLLTAARLTLLQAIKKQPDSITQLAQRLHRDRETIKRDVDELMHYGLVEIELTTLPGHRRMKAIHLRAERLRLEASIE